MLLTIFFAFLGACTVTEQNARRRLWLLIAAPLPIFFITLLAVSTDLIPVSALHIESSNIFLGLDWSLKPELAPLLIATAAIWCFAGLFAARDFTASAAASQATEAQQSEARQSEARQTNNQPHAARFLRCWLLTLTGNLGLLIANDIASFYLFFALMTFAAYGLVIHNETADALKAGKVYIIMAVIGEAFLLAGLIAAAATVGGEHTPLLQELPLGIASSEHGLAIAAALFIGFGVKAGVAGVHWWLPLAHPVAPTPASAVLSGAMIKAGLVGWILTLPLGDLATQANAVSTDIAPANLAPLASAAIILGFIGAWGAGVAGVLSDKAKTVLAYSSISQMGLLTVMLGVALRYPDSAALILAAIIAFACHHCLNKCILFLGVAWRKAATGALLIVVATVLVIAALNLIGVPFSTGAHAKDLFKAVIDDLPVGLLYAAFSYAALATTALMLRYGYLLWYKR